MSNRPKIKDIAATVGVSSATVSRALTGSGLVAEPTLSKIREAAIRLRYRPNVNARNLRTQKSMSILIVVRDIGNPFYLEVFKGAEHMARAAGYSVLMGNSEGDPDRETEYFDMLRDGHADGMILLTGQVPQQIRESGFSDDNVVVALEMIEEVRIPQILIDNKSAAKTAVNHLISLGHKNIAHVTGPIPEKMSALRLDGYLQAMSDAGIPICQDYIAPGDFTLRGGEEAARKLIELPTPPTAIFAANDEMAFGIIREAHRKKLNVPSDLSVVGFDDIFLSGAFLPSLTTICQPCLEVGQRSMTTLLRMLDGLEVSNETTTLSTNLVVRESTAPPTKQI